MSQWRQVEQLWSRGRGMPVSRANHLAALVILVVEDEFLVRCFIAERLRESGYVVIETESGEEAIALCKSAIAIDIVFTDIHLIGAATGWEVAECFHAERPDGWVLYTSGNPVEPVKCAHGAFMPKPYRYQDVVDAFEQLRRSAHP
jgi:CheY-like chemotaxis protein